MLSQLPVIAACRPLSLLLTSSSGFFAAESNTSTLTPIIEASCNAPSNCTTSMAALANALRLPQKCASPHDLPDARSCGQDLANGQPAAQLALDGLTEYDLQREATCLANPATQAYCFVEALSAKPPTNSYLYFLPSGSALPATAKASCDACSKATLGVYACVRLNAGLTNVAATPRTARSPSLRRTRARAVRWRKHAATTSSQSSRPAQPTASQPRSFFRSH